MTGVLRLRGDGPSTVSVFFYPTGQRNLYARVSRSDAGHWEAWLVTIEADHPERVRLEPVGLLDDRTTPVVLGQKTMLAHLKAIAAELASVDGSRDKTLAVIR